MATKMRLVDSIFVVVLHGVCCGKEEAKIMLFAIFNTFKSIKLTA
jgi:hypothetical protein